MGEEEIGEEGTEGVQEREVGKQVVEVGAANADFAAELASAFLGGLLGADGAGDESAVEPLLENFCS